MGDFLYRLFFTRDDDLDVLQVVFLLWVIFTAVCVVNTGLEVWKLSTPAWSVIGSVFATLAIAGTPKWIAELLAKRAPEPVVPDNTTGTYNGMAQYYSVETPPDEDE